MDNAIAVRRLIGRRLPFTRSEGREPDPIAPGSIRTRKTTRSATSTGAVKVLDFGLATAVEPELTHRFY